MNSSTVLPSAILPSDILPSDILPSDTDQVANTSDPFVGLPVSDGVRLAVTALGWLACVTGIFGNVLIVVTLLQQAALRSIHNIYIANLAAADLVFVAYTLPGWLLDLGLGRTLLAGKLHCDFNSFVVSLCFTVSVYTLVLIAANRYLCVCHHHIFNRFFTKARTVASCIALWLLSTVFSALPFFHLAGTSFTYNRRFRLCLQDFTDFSGLSSVKTILDLFLPSLLIGAFSLAVILFWKKTKNAVRQWNPRRDLPSRTGHHLGISSADIAIIRSLVSVFVILVVLYIPLAVAGLVSRATYVSTETFQFLVLLLFLNHSINWIVYGLMNKHFRDGYRRLLVRCCYNEVAPAADPTAITLAPLH